MRGVIAPDAIDAADLKHIGLADNRNGGRRYRKHRLGTSLCIGRRALHRSSRQRGGSGCENGPAIEGLHRALLVKPSFSEVVFTAFSHELKSALRFAALPLTTARCVRRFRAFPKKEGPRELRAFAYFVGRSVNV